MKFFIGKFEIELRSPIVITKRLVTIRNYTDMLSRCAKSTKCCSGPTQPTTDKRPEFIRRYVDDFDDAGKDYDKLKESE